MFSYDDKTVKSIIYRFINFEKTIKIPALSENDVYSLIAYLRYDSTILFHLGEVEYVFYPCLKEAVLKPCYLYSQMKYEAMVSQLTTIVQKIRDQVCVASTKLERELCIHDALCTKVTYADDGDVSHSIVGPLLYHRGVCDGISKIAKVLLQECGIEAHVIFGSASSSGGNSEPHAWNMVCLSGNWYHLDITFDNTLSNKNVRYDYFNVPTDEITADHTIDISSVCNKVECLDSNDYYIHNNTYFNSLAKLKEYLRQCFSQDKSNIQIRASKDLSENDIVKTFRYAASSMSKKIYYEQSINYVRNVYVWTIEYDK